MKTAVVLIVLVFSVVFVAETKRIGGGGGRRTSWGRPSSTSVSKPKTTHGQSNIDNTRLSYGHNEPTARRPATPPKTTNHNPSAPPSDHHAPSAPKPETVNKDVGWNVGNNAPNAQPGNIGWNVNNRNQGAPGGTGTHAGAPPPYPGAPGGAGTHAGAPPPYPGAPGGAGTHAGAPPPYPGAPGGPGSYPGAPPPYPGNQPGGTGYHGAPPAYPGGQGVHSGAPPGYNNAPPAYGNQYNPAQGGNYPGGSYPGQGGYPAGGYQPGYQGGAHPGYGGGYGGYGGYGQSPQQGYGNNYPGQYQGGLPGGGGFNSFGGGGGGFGGGFGGGGYPGGYGGGYRSSGISGTTAITSVLLGLTLWNLARDHNHYHTYAPNSQNVYRTPSGEVVNVSHDITPEKGTITEQIGNVSCVSVYNARAVSKWANNTLNDFHNSFPASAFPVSVNGTNQGLNFTVTPGKIIHNETLLVTCCGTEQGPVNLMKLATGKIENVNCIYKQYTMPFRQLKFIPINTTTTNTTTPTPTTISNATDTPTPIPVVSDGTSTNNTLPEVLINTTSTTTTKIDTPTATEILNTTNNETTTPNSIEITTIT